MKEETGLHLERSRMNLAAARLLLGHSLFSDSISRSYYAMFHAATAVLMEEGIERASHGVVIGAFNERIIKPNRLDAKFGRMLRDAFDARSISDYAAGPDDTQANASTMLARAEDFVAACTGLLAG